MDPVEEIKDRLDVSEVVGGYVQLKTSGNSLKGLCPFHHERTPSFMVNNEKRIWHCFGCSEGGDIFTFVQKIEGLDFPQALESLANKAGVTLADKAGSKATAELKERLFKILDLAAKYYQKVFAQSVIAQEYVIKKRGFNKEAVTTFRVGYAPNQQDGLVKLLKKQGYKDNEIVKAGLARSQGNNLIDLFRGRLMIPFADTNGRIIGFTGRSLSETIQPKYLNTPQTLLFDKSRFVFGLFQAKETIRQSKEAVLVEGNLDVITSHQFGVQQVVAVSGTALTIYQLKALARLTPNIKLAFDQDPAGLVATERAIKVAQNAGVSLHIVSVSDAKDPDELIRSRKDGINRWQAAIKDAPYVMDWLIETVAAQYDGSTAIGKKQITDRVLPTLAALNDEVEKDHYIQKLAQFNKISTEAIERKLEQLNQGEKKPVLKIPNSSYEPTPRDETKVVAEAFLSLNLGFADVRPSLDDLSEDYFSLVDHQQIFTALKAMGNKPIVDKLPPDLQAHEATVRILLIQGEMNYQHWAVLDRRIEAYTLAQRLQTLYIKKLKIQLNQQIKAAEAVGDKVHQHELLQKFRDLTV
jgi:DNA primase